LWDAREYVAALDASGVNLDSIMMSCDEFGSKRMLIDGKYVPGAIVEEVFTVLTPRLEAETERRKAEYRIQYLKNNFTPEQLEIAVAAYHAK
jgi:hypothetical protein